MPPLDLKILQEESKFRHDLLGVEFFEMRKREKRCVKYKKRFIPDKPKVIIPRAKGEYSNRSPYGIASDLLLQQLKTA